MVGQRGHCHTRRGAHGISRIDIPDWQEECLHMFVKGFGSTYAHVEQHFSSSIIIERAFAFVLSRIIHSAPLHHQIGMGYGIWESLAHLAGNRLGGHEKVWVIGVYGLLQGWIKTEATVST